MEKFKQLAKIKELYANGENIIKYLKSINNDELNVNLRSPTCFKSQKHFRIY